MNTPRNNPHINPEDPKWTAYVLGELDETERAEIEQLLETSDEARALVEELNLAAISLKEELAPMTSLMMTPEQRAVVESAMQPEPKRWFEVFPSRWGWGLAATAAAGLVLFFALPLTRVTNPEYPGVASDAQKVAKEMNGSATQEATADAGFSASIQPADRTAQAAQSLRAPIAVAPVVSPAEVATLIQGDLAAGRGAVRGAVTDPSNALIPGVMITAKDQNTGIVNTTVTNEAGVYDFAALTPGTYQLSAALPGFQTKTATNLEVLPSTQLRQDFPLNLGSVSSTVEVSVSSTDLLKSSGASVGQVLPQQRITDLPLVGNNVLELIQVLPGVQGAAPPPAAPSAPRLATTPAAGGRGGGGQRGGAAPAGAPVSAAIAGQQGQQGQGVGQGQLGGIGQGRGLTVRDGFSVQQDRAAAPPPPLPGGFTIDRIYTPGPNTEAYDRIVDNPFIRTTQENLATFSIDVDTASYANMRRFLTQNQMPPRDSVRIEELINYFNYDYAQPRGNDPIAPNMEVAATPWNPQSRLVRIGIKAKEIDANRRPPSNLVFLIDVSGSMNTPQKLPLVKSGLKMLVDRLGENDSVSIVVYAGASGLVLAPTSAINKERIQQAIDSLQPGGSTNGASGIQLAYNQAVANLIKGGTNRVILMTDGDFNVGTTNQGDLTRLIEERAKSGVFLTVLGFGMGNIKDSTLEKLADQGNGHYAYIDSINEARKVLVEEIGSTLVTVAKDVKIQVDFNPARVEAYRLIGYENRVLRAEDFNNDLKDAGDMGAGHTVTALFEVIPKGGSIPGPSIDPSKYTTATANAAEARIPAGASNELLTLRVRYKLPEASTSTKLDFPLVDQGRPFARATADYRFAAAVAEFGMILRESPYRGNASMDTVLDLAEGSRGQDRNGYRQEFIQLVQRAKRLR